MKQPRTKLSHMIADRTLKTGSSKQLGQEVAAYLIRERRVAELESILRDIQVEWAEAGHVEVTATSAHTLTPKVRADIDEQVKKLYPEAKKIVINEVHDPAILGGVRLSLADRQLDLSVEAKLNKFKQLTITGKEK